MHGEFEEFFVVLTELPPILIHLLAELVEFVGIVALRIIGLKLAPFGLGHLDEFGSYRAGELTALAQDHVPDIVGYHAPASLALLHLHHVHQREVLDILAEWGDEAGITHLGPYVCHLIKELDEELVCGEFGLLVLDLPLVERLEIVFKVGHERAHHATWQTWLDEERVVDMVEGWDIVAKEVVIHLLYLCANLHISLHVDVLDLETSILEHLLYGDDISMTRSP